MLVFGATGLSMIVLGLSLVAMRRAAGEIAVRWPRADRHDRWPSLASCVAEAVVADNAPSALTRVLVDVTESRAAAIYVRRGESDLAERTVAVGPERGPSVFRIEPPGADSGRTTAVDGRADEQPLSEFRVEGVLPYAPSAVRAVADAVADAPSVPAPSDAASLDQVAGLWSRWEPIVVGRGTIGFLGLSGKAADGAAYDAHEEAAIALVVPQIGNALELVRLQALSKNQEIELARLQECVAAEAALSPARPRPDSVFPEILGSAQSLRAVLDVGQRVAPSDLPVLVTGETGTGKELVARALHRLSRRSGGPFVCVNCPAIPQDLAESQLFGHMKGSFTGAAEAHEGMFEAADGGTIFLDEVGDLPPNIQVKLLRVLQEGEVQRVGSRQVRKIDVRIVSATNRDLREEVRQGRFREDLYYRLTGMRMHLPPLRQRPEDIEVLLGAFLEEAGSRSGQRIRGLTADALKKIRRHDWPGNVRELRSLAERLVMLHPGETVNARHIVECLVPDAYDADLDDERSLTGMLRDEKIRRAQQALKQADGNQAAAARILGMSRSNFHRLLKRYGLHPGDI